jgi:hypothetical protein
MLRRLLVGLVLGSVVGVALAAGLVAWLKITTFQGVGGALEAYAAALVVGVVAGLVAGKPIWASNAKVEAGIKALFGALLAAGGMFALRRWASGWTVDLHALGAGGPAAVGDLPAASLPVIGAALGALFEVDNTGDAAAARPGAARQRVASPTAARADRGAALDDGASTASPLRGRTLDDDEGLPPSRSDLASKRAK